MNDVISKTPNLDMIIAHTERDHKTITPILEEFAEFFTRHQLSPVQLAMLSVLCATLVESYCKDPHGLREYGRDLHTAWSIVHKRFFRIEGRSLLIETPPDDEFEETKIFLENLISQQGIRPFNMIKL